MPLLETPTTILLLWAVIGYGLGSIPFGMVLARIMGLGNLREIGSGNIGATNVLRTGNKLAAVLTLLLDAAKGAAALLLARYATGSEAAAQLAGLAAMLGHCYPVWLRFQGALGSAAASTCLIMFLGVPEALAVGTILTLLIYWRHRANIARIKAGTEPKIGQKTE